MSNYSRRGFIKASSIAASAALLSAAAPKQVNAQEENALFLPLFSMSPDPQSELSSLLRAQHLDDHIVQTAALMEPYIRFTGEQFEIISSFNADEVGVTAEQLAYIDVRLSYKNSQLQNNSTLQAAVVESYSTIQAAGCNRSGTEWGFWHHKQYYTNQDANDIARDLGRFSLGMGVGPALWKWFARIHPLVGPVVTVYSLAASGMGQWITEVNKGCGIVMYHGDMAPLPFWIAGQ